MKGYLVKDDYDQKSVCVVITDTEEEAIKEALRMFPNTVEGEAYAIALEVIDARPETA